MRLSITLIERPLLFPRALTTYLTLIALLCGNVAGWVHVGCCDPAEHAVASVVGQSAEDACCCSHHCQSADESDSPGDDGSPTPEHDSDRCLVCQTFLESRHSAWVIADSVAWSPLVERHTTHERDDVFVAAELLSEISVRGPPVTSGICLS